MRELSITGAIKLIEEAKLASEHSYSPYSQFIVGAAVQTEDGTIFRGTNVENTSYGLTICAERAALINAVSAGHKQIVALAVYAPVDSISPCGACRQFITEFGKDVVVIFKQDQKIIQRQISELLPFRFEMPPDAPLM
jgi:cytidine deaminase